MRAPVIPAFVDLLPTSPWIDQSFENYDCTQPHQQER